MTKSSISIACMPIEHWNWWLLGDPLEPRLATIVVLVPDDMIHDALIVSMTASCSEMATDYGCFELDPTSEHGLKAVTRGDSFGRCTNECDDGDILDRDYASMAQDAFRMAIDGQDIDESSALVIGFGADIQPDETDEYVYELISDFQSLSGERGPAAFWRIMIETLYIGRTAVMQSDRIPKRYLSL